MNKMYETIGRAVIAAQIFESLIVICAEFLRVSSDIISGKTNDGLINPNKFKVATRTILKELSNTNNIDSNFESRISILVEKRHTLIHRWFVKNGLPEEIEEIQKLTLLAQEVEKESNFIAKKLAEYMVNVNDSENPSVEIINIFKKINMDED